MSIRALTAASTLALFALLAPPPTLGCGSYGSMLDRDVLELLDDNPLVSLPRWVQFVSEGRPGIARLERNLAELEKEVLIQQEDVDYFAAKITKELHEGRSVAGPLEEHEFWCDELVETRRRTAKLRACLQSIRAAVNASSPTA